MNERMLIEKTISCGAGKATVIPVSQIVMAKEFRDICAGNGCGKYGRCWTCPPDIGDVHALMDKVRKYARGLCFQTIVQIEDSFDIEGMSEGSRAHARVSRDVRRALLAEVGEAALFLGCGGCGLCDECTKPSGEPCRHPEDACAAMEGYGIDVYNTVKDTGLKYINGQNTVTFFGLVLYGEG